MEEGCCCGKPCCAWRHLTLMRPCKTGGRWRNYSGMAPHSPSSSGRSRLRSEDIDERVKPARRKNMKSPIKRLRESKDRVDDNAAAESHEGAEGHDAGREWAKNQA